MKKLKVAVIGVGFWGKNHVRVFRELPETDLVAVCDRDIERAEEVAKKYEVEAYRDSQDVLKREDIEAASICTWTTTHAMEAMKALTAGKHILVEKPLANTVENAKRIVESAINENLHLMVGFIERFNPGVQKAKEILETGKIGELVSASGKRVSQWPERIGDVGVVKDYAIHEIDIVRSIFEADPIAVYAQAGKLKHKKYEDYVQMMLTFKRTKTAFIEANWLTPYKIRDLTLVGSKGTMSLNYLTQGITLETEKETLKPRRRWEEPLKLELQHFARSILKDKPPEVSGVDGLKALTIAEAALESSSLGCVVKLNLDKQISD